MMMAIRRRTVKVAAPRTQPWSLPAYHRQRATTAVLATTAGTRPAGPNWCEDEGTMVRACQLQRVVRQLPIHVFTAELDVQGTYQEVVLREASRRSYRTAPSSASYSHSDR